MYLKHDNSIFLTGAIPSVCDNKIDNATDLINVDFPAALGPVTIILFGKSTILPSILLLCFDSSFSELSLLSLLL